MKHRQRKLTILQWLVVVNCLIAVCIISLAVILDWWAGLPDVHVSHELNHCIEVINHREGDNYDCHNLPEKYHFSWTE